VFISGNTIFAGIVCIAGYPSKEIPSRNFIPATI